MFRTILVPLDGSGLAEQALPSACRLAEQFDSELLLLRVVLPDRALNNLPVRTAYPPVVPAAPPCRAMDEAKAYLTSLELPVPGLRVRTEVVWGMPPDAIIETAARHGVDLIVMSTHGRAGLLRLLYGSVAEAVLRGTTVPVLLVPSRAAMRQALDEAPLVWPKPVEKTPVA